MESPAGVKYVVVKTQDSFNKPMWGVVVTWTDARRRSCADTVTILDDQHDAKKCARRLNHRHNSTMLDLEKYLD